eukprot:6445003-Alexandrium_andersonii.AAC.1
MPRCREADREPRLAERALGMAARRPRASGRGEWRGRQRLRRSSCVPRAVAVAPQTPLAGGRPAMSVVGSALTHPWPWCRAGWPARPRRAGGSPRDPRPAPWPPRH